MSINIVNMKLHYFILTLVLTLVLGILCSYLVFLKIMGIVKEPLQDNIQLFVPGSKQYDEQFQTEIYSKLIHDMALLDAFQKKNAETAKAIVEESFHSDLLALAGMAQNGDDPDTVPKINKADIVKYYEMIDQKNLENDSSSTGELSPEMDRIIKQYLYGENH